MKETTNCLSSKIPSSLARMPPNTASSAATTAIGRYGSSAAGTVGSSQIPRPAPTTRAMTAIIGHPRSPGTARGARHGRAGRRRRAGMAQPWFGRRGKCHVVLLLHVELHAVRLDVLGEPLGGHRGGERGIEVVGADRPHLVRGGDWPGVQDRKSVV